MSGYDPLEVSEKVREEVVKDDQRKYYRFRSARFYGGIATADCVGCNLSCNYCWSKNPRKQPEHIGDFYSPREVMEKLVEIADRKDFPQVRVSGNEPTIGKEHLLSLMSEFEGTSLKFILETNGILLGDDPSYTEEMKDFENIHVRVSLKGTNPDQFEKLTGADKKGFELQLQSLRNLVKREIVCHVAVIEDFADKEKISNLKETLREIDPLLTRTLELEKLMLYPHVKKQLSQVGIEIPEK